MKTSSELLPIAHPRFDAAKSRARFNRDFGRVSVLRGSYGRDETDTGVFPHLVRDIIHGRESECYVY